jgi:hypothetical protein
VSALACSDPPARSTALDGSAGHMNVRDDTELSAPVAGSMERTLRVQVLVTVTGVRGATAAIRDPPEGTIEITVEPRPNGAPSTCDSAPVLASIAMPYTQHA